MRRAGSILLATVLSAVLLLSATAAQNDVERPSGDILPEVNPQVVSTAADPVVCKATDYTSLKNYLSVGCDGSGDPRVVEMRCNNNDFYFRYTDDPLMLVGQPNGSAAIQKWELKGCDLKAVKVNLTRNPVLPALTAVGTGAPESALFLHDIAFSFVGAPECAPPNCPALIDISGFKIVTLIDVAVNVAWGKNIKASVLPSNGISIKGADVVFIKSTTVKNVQTGVSVEGGNLTMENCIASKNKENGLKYTCSSTGPNTVAVGGQKSLYKDNEGSGVYVECLPAVTPDQTVTVKVGAGATIAGNNGRAVVLRGSVDATIGKGC